MKVFVTNMEIFATACKISISKWRWKVTKIIEINSTEVIRKFGNKNLFCYVY
jgi:hypothetical protein